MNIENPTPLSAPAPLENSVATGHLWTDIVQYAVKTDVNSSIKLLSKNHLQGCGKVDLIKVILTCVGTDDKASVKAGLVSVGSPATFDHIGMSSDGISYVSNPTTKGIRHEFTLVPPDFISRQIQPTSADLPEMKIMIERTATMNVSLMLYFKVTGVRIKYETLN